MNGPQLHSGRQVTSFSGPNSTSPPSPLLNIERPRSPADRYVRPELVIRLSLPHVTLAYHRDVKELLQARSHVRTSPLHGYGICILPFLFPLWNFYLPLMTSSDSYGSKTRQCMKHDKEDCIMYRATRCVARHAKTSGSRVWGLHAAHVGCFPYSLIMILGTILIRSERVARGRIREMQLDVLYPSNCSTI